jgi:hypothetical protein
MAQVIARFTATILDEDGVKAGASAHLSISDASTVAQLDTELSNWLTVLDGVTGGQIIRANAVVIPALPGGLKAAPIAGSEVQEAASFDFSQTGIPYHYGNVVPAFLETLELADGKPNLAAGAVVAYIADLLSAPLGGHYTGLGADNLVALSYAFLPTRKRRRAQNRLSRVDV